MTAAGLTIESSRDIHGVNRSASGASENAAVCTIDVDVARAGVSTHTGTDARNLQASRTCVGLERSRYIRNGLSARAGGRPNLSAGWNRDLVTDGDVVLELRIIDVADANIISALLDWRIVFQFLDLFFCVIVKPLARINVTDHM